MERLRGEKQAWRNNEEERGNMGDTGSGNGEGNRRSRGGRMGNEMEKEHSNEMDGQVGEVHREKNGLAKSRVSSERLVKPQKIWKMRTMIVVERRNKRVGDKKEDMVKRICKWTGKSSNTRVAKRKGRPSSGMNTKESKRERQGKRTRMREGKGKRKTVSKVWNIGRIGGKRRDRNIWKVVLLVNCVSNVVERKGK